ncbi:hypothetical protein BWQ96_10194 [Gracilariopsis chorda]|uniref:Uncharacterized protein n=1 Tax=Gracilariopsis chorda TaxID=448386 RepID=A0A2V3IDD6_9FLOR|nr:hypothetical protein BWQ96_10194 [Gracilariopsis chorda]|eukprot:PXF40096.1 hypothetical protein BWQ96_10194 [Gracilariopsis chorda]
MHGTAETQQRLLHGRETIRAGTRNDYFRRVSGGRRAPPLFLQRCSISKLEAVRYTTISLLPCLAHMFTSLHPVFDSCTVFPITTAC